MIFWFFVIYITVRIISIVAYITHIFIGDYPREIKPTIITSPGVDFISIIFNTACMLFAIYCLKLLKG
jgi:hypothetical protein